jgi:hypothetical protein
MEGSAAEAGVGLLAVMGVAVSEAAEMGQQLKRVSQVAGEEGGLRKRRWVKEKLGGRAGSVVGEESEVGSGLDQGERERPQEMLAEREEDAWWRA